MCSLDSMQGLHLRATSQLHLLLFQSGIKSAVLLDMVVYSEGVKGGLMTSLFLELERWLSSARPPLIAQTLYFLLDYAHIVRSSETLSSQEMRSR